MRILQAEQRSDEWFAARLGKATASNFANVLADKTTAAYRNYRVKLALEGLSGKQEDVFQSDAMRQGTEREPLHYLRAGVNKHSVMNLYVSKLSPQKRFGFTTSTNGSPRAMVPIGNYEEVMPLDILPTQLLRSLIVGDTEMAQKLGALELDEEDLALCTYVCAGKYEYGPILRDNLTRIEKEG